MNTTLVAVTISLFLPVVPVEPVGRPTTARLQLSEGKIIKGRVVRIDALRKTFAVKLFQENSGVKEVEFHTLDTTVYLTPNKLAGEFEDILVGDDISCCWLYLKDRNGVQNCTQATIRQRPKK